MRHTGLFTPREDQILDRVLVDHILRLLTEEEGDILRLWLIDELTLSEIGKVVGRRYRGKPLTGSTIRYHRDRIVMKLREALGLS